MLSFRNLVHFLCNKVSSLRSDTWCSFLLVLWFDITHTNTNTHTDTQHTQGPVDQHTHVNKYLHQLLCAHSSYLYYNEWIIHWHQKFTFHNVFSFQRLFTCKSHICWLDAIRLSSFCETFFKITPYFIKPPLFMKKIWIDLLWTLLLFQKSEHSSFFENFENSNLNLYKEGRPQLWKNTQDYQTQYNFQNQNDALVPSFLRYCCSNCRYWLLQSD